MSHGGVKKVSRIIWMALFFKASVSSFQFLLGKRSDHPSNYKLSSTVKYEKLLNWNLKFKKNNEDCVVHFLISISCKLTSWRAGVNAIKEILKNSCSLYDFGILDYHVNWSNTKERMREWTKGVVLKWRHAVFDSFWHHLPTLSRFLVIRLVYCSHKILDTPYPIRPLRHL